MTWTSAGTMGSAQSKTSGPSLALTTTATAAIGNVIVVAVAANNLGIADGATTQLSVTDAAGNIYTRAAEFTNSGNNAAENGAVSAVFFTRALAQLNSGQSITVVSSGAVVAKAASAWRFSLTGNTVEVASLVGLANRATDPGVISVSGLPSQEYLFLHGLAAEGPNADAYTWQSGYTQVTGTGTTGGGAATNMHVRGGFAIASGTQSTVNVTSNTADRDYAQVLVALREFTAVPNDRLDISWVQLEVPDAGPRTFYVDPAGSNSNTGSSSSPFQTILHGLSVMLAGDTLYIRPGIYPEAIIDAIPGGSVSSPVTIAKDPLSSGVVTVRPNAGALRVVSFSTAVGYITISGLVLDGANITSDTVKMTNGAHHITLANCEILNGPQQGVLITEGTNGSGTGSNTLRSCNIHDNGTTDLHHQVYISKSGGNTVEDCELHNSFGYAIHQYDGPMSGNVYRRNRVHNSFGILMSSGSSNDCYYNLCYGNQGDITVGYSEASSRVLNNTCYGGTRGISTHGASQGATFGILVRNNISYGHTDFSGNYLDEGTSTIQDHNLFGVDPKFVSIPLQNFHLLSTSPAIDAGLAVAGLTQDLDLNAVPFGPLPDIGAYEFQGSPDTPPSAPTGVTVR